MRLRTAAAKLGLGLGIGGALLGATTAPALALTVAAKPAAAQEGSGFTSTVATFTDGFGLLGCTAAGQYSAVITWGDGTTSSGTVTGGVGMLLAGCLYAVDGAHTYAEEGSFALSVTITGPSASGVSDPETVAVRDAPLSAAGTRFTANQNTSAAATVATFTDANPGATAADFMAIVAFGDGTTGAAAVAATGGGFSVTATHTYPRTGSFSVAVAVKDAGGSLATAGAAATVLAASTAPRPGVTPPGSSPAPAPLRLGLAAPVLARGGTVVVAVRCPVAARTCRGRLSVATVADHRSRLPQLRSAQTLGTTLFIIPGGRQAQLSVRPKQAVVALLRQAGAVKVAASASSFDAATGRSQVASLTATLQLSRR